VTTRTNDNIRTRPKLGNFRAKIWCDWDFGYRRRLGDLITSAYKSDFNETNLFSAQNWNETTIFGHLSEGASGSFPMPMCGQISVWISKGTACYLHALTTARNCKHINLQLLSTACPLQGCADMTLSARALGGFPQESRVPLFNFLKSIIYFPGAQPRFKRFFSFFGMQYAKHVVHHTKWNASFIFAMGWRGGA
jgi:hypothetical protein